ncbi:unnamed protein product [Mycena citricolor]|uniref:Uncharacterized protein n=1 Tax=Mycena citricolor TaxID=2018698 RepID=A0AAD2HT16_9AGAR|nr:unnamed protein product [Mycena citricolor]
MSSSSSHFASFAAYTPPPDETTSGTSSKAPVRPWFPSHASETSYQSGGIPTFNTSAGGGLASVEEAEGEQNQWETRHGLRVDVSAAAAYLLGPISGTPARYMSDEDSNSYQSALLTTPLVVVRIFASLLRFPGWMRTIFTILLLGAELYMAFRAFIDASHNGLARFQVPYIGPIAARWLADE